jgi:hypothetical protein
MSTPKYRGYAPAVPPDEDPAVPLDHFDAPADALVEAINASIAVGEQSGNRHRFNLRHPTTLTVKTAQGSFKKTPMREGAFELAAARVGKRIPVILVFKPCFMSDYRFMEMGATDAEQYLEGFADFFEVVLAAAQGRGQPAGRKSPAEPDVAAPVYAEGIFGSW